MRIALLGDFDSYIVRGLPPPERVPHQTPGVNLVRGFREVGGHEIHLLIVTREVARCTTEPGPLGTVHLLPCPALSGSACFFLWRRHLLLRQLRQIQPDIVHGQGTEGEYALTAVTSPYPHVVTIHGILHQVHRVTRPPLWSLQHVPRWAERLVASRARHVICISSATADFLTATGSPAQRYHIPNAVAPCFFAGPPRSRSEPAQQILFVGSLYPLKGLLPLVEALGLLNIPAQLRIIGIAGAAAADYVAQVRNRAIQLGVDQRIHWLGARNETEVAKALTDADVLVLPSFQETAPMCVAEAMAAGVPVVASAVGGIPDMVAHGEEGLLVPPGEPAALAQALRKILTNSVLRARLALAAQAKARRLYAPAIVARQTLAVYEQIIRAESR